MDLIDIKNDYQLTLTYGRVFKKPMSVMCKLIIKCYIYTFTDFKKSVYYNLSYLLCEYRARKADAIPRSRQKSGDKSMKGAGRRVGRLSRDDFFSFRPGRLLNPVSRVTYLTRGNVNSREGSWAACANRLWSRNLFLLPRVRGPSLLPLPPLIVVPRDARCILSSSFAILLLLRAHAADPTAPGSEITAPFHGRALTGVWVQVGCDRAWPLTRASRPWPPPPLNTMLARRDTHDFVLARVCVRGRTHGTMWIGA